MRSGMMPTSVVGVPFRVNTRLTMAGSCPNRVVHSRWLMTNTGGAPGFSSSRVSVRPMAASAPMNEKVLPDVKPPMNCSVPCGVDQSTSSPPPAIVSENDVACSR